MILELFWPFSFWLLWRLAFGVALAEVFLMWRENWGCSIRIALPASTLNTIDYLLSISLLCLRRCRIEDSEPTLSPSLSQLIRERGICLSL
jgi:hypothetical protein